MEREQVGKNQVWGKWEDFTCLTQSSLLSLIVTKCY